MQSASQSGALAQSDPPLWRPSRVTLIALIIFRCGRGGRWWEMFCVQEVIIKSLAKISQLLPKQHRASASEQWDRWFVLGLDHHSQVQEYSHNPRLTVLSIILYNSGGATASVYFSLLNKDFDFCFQTIFSPLSHGRRRNLPLMTAVLIKPLGSPRTLTTWTDCQLFYPRSCQQ